LLSSHGFAEGGCRQTHALLVLTAPNWNFSSMRFKGMPEAGYVSMPKNGDYSREKRFVFAIDNYSLGD
jgi:hypothetical protein